MYEPKQQQKQYMKKLLQIRKPKQQQGSLLSKLSATTTTTTTMHDNNNNNRCELAIDTLAKVSYQDLVDIMDQSERVHQLNKVYETQIAQHVALATDLTSRIDDLNNQVAELQNLCRIAVKSLHALDDKYNNNNKQ